MLLQSRSEYATRSTYDGGHLCCVREYEDLFAEDV